MANNTFQPANNAINVPERPEQHVDFTEVNLSHDFIGTCTMGQIVPFLFFMTNPGDFVRASGEYLFRFAPMYLPIFTQVKVYIDYFYCPLRLLWGIPKNALGDGAGGKLTELQGWETFISSFDDTLDMPYIEIPMSDYSLTGMDELLSYLGIPTYQTGTLGLGILQVSPFPFLMYLFIYDTYMRNDQVQDTRFFRWFDAYPYDYTTIVSALAQIGQASTGRIQMLRRNWPNDYFTIMTPTPQLGANVLIPMIAEDGYWDSIIGAPTISYPSRWLDLQTGGAATIGDPLDIDPTIAGMSNAGGTIVGLDIQETAATVRQLRVSLQTTEILERALRAGDKYPDFLIKFFDEDPNPLEIDEPQWFGGHVGRVVISDVYQTATTDPTERTGAYAGTAVAVNNTQRYEVKIREHGYVMGLLTVIPDASYQNGLPRHWTYQKWHDLYWEQFSQIGDRAMQRMELQLILQPDPSIAPDAVVNHSTFNIETIGYVPYGHEWRYQNNVVAGQMRTLWTSYHLGRIFGQNIASYFDLNDEFLVCIPRVTDVFQVSVDDDFREHECYILVHNNVTVDRKIAKWSVPQT